MTSKGQLEKFYGLNTAMVIDGFVERAGQPDPEFAGLGSIDVLPDDPEQLAPMGIRPVIGNDPWQIKLALADLDQALAKRGEMIGALLIVGGPKLFLFTTYPTQLLTMTWMCPQTIPTPVSMKITSSHNGCRSFAR